MKKELLVSICIPNYNYGQYLEQCLESIYNQTYKNIEVFFRDNASTDNSLEIALKYKKKFSEKGIFMSVEQNKVNLGSDVNSQLVSRDTEGEIIYTIASDDAIEPTFIEKAVKVFSNYPNVGCVMTHRAEIDKYGTIRHIKPFYNKSCIVKGEEQAAVFMMAGIAIPSQRIIRREVANKIKKFHRTFEVAGDWFDNFMYACVSDIAYINEPLCIYRVHNKNETSASEINLLGIFEHYKLINTFVSISKSLGLVKPVKRYNEAVNKLGSMCIRYAVKMLKANEIKSARRYLQLAPVFDEDIIENEQYKKIKKWVELDSNQLKEILKNEPDIVRKVSYDPPKESKEIII